MNRGKIIVVEGPSNSGKTTTCQGMKKYANCVVIDECMVYESKPPRPSENYEQELANQLFFFEVERRRLTKATKFALEGKNVVLDRCALSTVAISYAFERLGKYRTFGHAIREYEKLLHDPTILIPDEYIFLYTDEDNIIQRNKTRTKELSKHWVDNTFTDFQNEFYEIVSRKIPHSQRISTTGKAKEYVSTIIAQILNVPEIDSQEL